MGGRLQHFIQFWEKTLLAPPHIVNILHGYQIPLNGHPPLSIPNINKRTPMSLEKQMVIDTEVAALLAKGAIREVKTLSPSYVSNIFLVPKKDGGMRPIINLKPLNRQFISAPHFRMDTVKDVSNLLRPGDFCASIDLKDAYFHVPIHPKSVHLLRFVWKGKVYEFLVLPFGLCTAPFVFTKISRPLAAFLRSKGIRIIFYLDDILVIGSSMSECLSHLQLVIDTLQSAGFVLNWKKSSLTPAQRFLFLGLWWDTAQEVVSLEERKLVSLHSQASLLQNVAHRSCQAVMKLLGFMTAAIPAVPLIRLHCRQLQRSLNSVYKTSLDLRRPLPLSQGAIEELRWVLSLSLDVCQAPIWPQTLEDADLTVATDASNQGWGIYFLGRMESGLWDASVPLHINVKELMALMIFLQDFLPSVDRPVSTLLWETDSTTALSYIRKEGGTQSAPLLALATEILILADNLGLKIIPVYVPSEENLHADFASRFKSLPDLHLHPQVFKKICLLWGRPQIDLFASTDSAQLPRFVAWGESPLAEAFDALSLHWKFQMAYLFPPLPLIPRVLTKLRKSVGNYILITPFWPAQSWFPDLLQLNVQAVRRLPLLPDLVVDLQTGLPPPLLNSLHLVVWMISETPTVCEMSTIAHSSSLKLDGEDRLMTDTNEPGQHSSDFCVPGEFKLLQSL